MTPLLFLEPLEASPSFCRNDDRRDKTGRPQRRWLDVRNKLPPNWFGPARLISGRLRDLSASTVRGQPWKAARGEQQRADENDRRIRRRRALAASYFSGQPIDQRRRDNRRIGHASLARSQISRHAAVEDSKLIRSALPSDRLYQESERILNNLTAAVDPSERVTS
jgi:hypothetical protein